MSVALLLAHVGDDAAAARVDKAVEDHLASRGDEKLSTAEVGRSDPAKALAAQPQTDKRTSQHRAQNAAGFDIALRHRPPGGHPLRLGDGLPDRFGDG